MAYFPFRNIGLKVLSIFIAALLWLVVAGDRVVERAVRVPVEFQNLPTGLEIVGEPPDVVDVRLRGSSGALGRLGPGDMAALIDLRGARAGRRLFHLTASHINVPYGMEVVQVAPATLLINFENSAVRIVRVRPSVEGQPAAGYEVVSITSEPSTVEVVGPESSLRGLDEAITEPVSIANATRGVHEVVTLGVADPAVRLRTAQSAAITVQIVPGASTRVLNDVPVTVDGLDEALRGRLTPASVSVTVRGTAEAVRMLTPQALDARVDAEGLDAGDHTREVRVGAGPGMTIEAVDPPTLQLRVTKP
jgi:YbbR domain-containing protein